MSPRPRKNDGYKSLSTLVNQIDAVLVKRRELEEHGSSRVGVSEEERQLLSKALEAFTSARDALQSQLQGASGEQRASQLQVTKATYSRRVIKGLKNLTKAPIKGRSTTSVTRHADAFVSSLQAAVRHLKQAIDPTYCSIVIGAYPSVLYSFMPKVFAEMEIGGAFWKHFPNAEIQCTPIGDADVDQAIARGTVDVAMCGARSRASRYQSETPELFAAEELGLLIPESLRPTDKTVAGRWKQLDSWLMHNKPRKGKRAEPFDFAWLQGLTYFKQSDEFNTLLRSLLGDKLEGLRPSVLVYTNRDVRRYVEEGLGFGLGHRPLRTEDSRIRFVSLDGLRIKDLTDDAHRHLSQVLKRWYPIYLTYDPTVVGSMGKHRTVQEELLQAVIVAIRVAAVGFSYRLS